MAGKHITSPRHRLPMLLDLWQCAARDESGARCMRRSEGAVVCKHELSGRLADRVRERVDRRESFPPPVNGSYVNRVDAAGMAFHRFGINFGIALAAVADQHERQALVGPEDAFDVQQLLAAAHAGENSMLAPKSRRKSGPSGMPFSLKNSTSSPWKFHGPFET